MISGEDPIRRLGKVEEAVVTDTPDKKPARRKDGVNEKHVNKISRRGSNSSLKHQRSTDSSESENAVVPKTKSASSRSASEGEGSKRSLQRTDSERSSTKRKGKKISPPDSTPEIAGGSSIFYFVTDYDKTPK